MNQSQKMVVFDMDGTVYDSLEDLANSANYALSAHNLPTHPVESYRHFVGNGIVVLAQKIMGEHYEPTLCQKVLETFNGYYKQHYHDVSKPYEGILELLKALKGQGVLLGIFSNKPHPFVLSIVQKSFPDVFDVVYGKKEELPLKPDPTVLNLILEQSTVLPQNCVYVGDSGVDMQTGHNAGVPTIGVTWGFRAQKELENSGGTVFADTPAQLQALILSQFRQQ